MLNKHLKSSIALMVASAVLFSGISFSATAETVYAKDSAAVIMAEYAEQEETITPSNADATEGTIDGFSWSLDENTLTISGSGVFSATDVPWEASSVQKVILEEGITGIGDYAFAAYTCLTSVTFPDSLKTIGAHAFEDKAINAPTFPEGLTSIGAYAFSQCHNFRSLTLPKSLTSIGDHAFDHITSLKAITLQSDPEKLTVGASAFSASAITVTVPCLYSEEWTEEKQTAFEASVPSSSVTFSLRPHIHTTASAVPATCTENGNTGSDVCSVCGKVFSVAGVIPALGHEMGEYVYDDNATCTSDATKTGTCTRCGETFSVSISGTKLGHNISTVTNPATATANGSIVKTCSRCDYKKTTTIAKASTIKLAATSYIYTGSRIKPAITVKDANGNKISSSYYTVKYGKNKSVGTGVVKIVFKGRYSGTVKKTFSIVARTAKISSLKNTASGVKITWKKVAGAAGYRIYRGKTLIKTIKSGSTKTYTDTKATTNGKKYTYKVVPYAKKGKGSFKKTKAASTIYLAAEGIKSLKASGTSMTVKYKKNSKATGYKIKYVVGSTSKTVTVKSYATVKKVIKSLKAGKTYKVYVRSYKKSGKKTYYSAWSVVKSVTIPTAQSGTGTLVDPSTCSHTWKEMTPGDTTFWMCPKCGKTVYTDPPVTVTPTPTPTPTPTTTPADSDCEHVWKAVYTSITNNEKSHEEDQGKYVQRLITGDYWTEYLKRGSKCEDCDWSILDEDYDCNTRFELPLQHEKETGHTVDQAVFLTDPDEPEYYVEPDYDNVYVSNYVTIIDQEAYDEYTVRYYKCTKCGEKKSSSLS